MMKSFFKKLAFVMALAMVVSMAAPAATTASAAEEMKIGYQNGAVITELNLTEARSSEDLKPVGAPSNWKELGITWISSNPAVATVDNAGVVTAVSAGTAELMVTCGDYTATIPVNCFADAKAYDVTIGVDGERSITEKTLKVGEEFDFKFFGVLDYGRDKVNNAPRYFCEWDSTDTAVATVDKNGLVKAVAPGKAKITLIVWNLATGTKHNVTPTWVTVEEVEAPKAAMEAKQTSEYVAELKFNNTTVTKEEVEKGLKAYYFIGDNKVELPVSVDEVKDGVAKVRSFATFVEGWKYTYEYAGLEANFEAYIGKAVKLVPYYGCSELKIAGKAYTNYNTYIGCDILNDKGIVITDSAKNIPGAAVEISLVNEAYDGSFTLDTFNQTVYFTQAGKVANIKLEYFTGEVDASGNRVVAASAVLPVVSEKEPAYTMASVADKKLSNYSLTLSTDDIANGGKTNLWVSFWDTEGAWVDAWKSTDARHVGHFSYKTTMDSVLSVDANGQVTPNAPGTANILVYYDYDLLDNVEGNVVAIVPITVIGSRNVTYVSNYLDSTSNVIATFEENPAATYLTDYTAATDVTGVTFDQARFVIESKDQTWGGINHEKHAYLVCNNKTLPTTVNNGQTVRLVNYLQVTDGSNTTVAGTDAFHLTPDSTGKYVLTFTAPYGTFNAAYTSGYTYSFTVTIDGKQTSFSITVKSPTYATATHNNDTPDDNTDDFQYRYIVNQGYELKVRQGNSIDLKVNEKKDINAQVSYYNVSNGVHYAIENVQSKTNTANAYRAAGTYYYSVTALKDGLLADSLVNTDLANGKVVKQADNSLLIPLARTDKAFKASQIPNNWDGTEPFLNKSVNGVDNYSVTIYQATESATGATLRIAAQQSINVTDTQEKITYAGKTQNYYNVNQLINWGITPSIEDLVKSCFKFNYNGGVLAHRDNYGGDFCTGLPVKMKVVYNVNNVTNAGSFADGEVYYINKVIFYIPVDVWSWYGNPVYIQQEVKINDYVVIER